MYFKYRRVLDDIEKHLKAKEPFSVVRVGDGDIKLLWELYKGRINEQKFHRSGIPKNQSKSVMKIYKEGCNSANFTTSFEYYLGPNMWNRKFSPGTRDKVRQWQKVYENIGIKNTNYCSPEIGFLFFMNHVENNLFNQMQGKKVCVITCYKKLPEIMKDSGIDISVFRIPAVGKGHYNVYPSRVTQLREMVSENRYDLYLISAGALGKGYSHHIKGMGGISIDVGQVVMYWMNRRIAARFKGIITRSDRYTFKFTKKGQKFDSLL